MSKLPKAPLIEVIAELSWITNTPEELEKFRFLLGNMYIKLKDKYPLRINLVQIPLAGMEVPLDVFKNKPVYRFRKNENSYPIYQLGPGLLSVNTINETYIWEDFEKEVLDVFAKFKESYDFNPSSTFDIALKYLDFYPFDFNHNAYSFLKDNLHLQIIHSMQSEKHNPSFVNFATGHKENTGQFNFSINRGMIQLKGEGFLVETSLKNKIILDSDVDISSWLNSAHEYLSTVFKDMTKGAMYDSFFN
ncbi:MAG: TIGR04255 family protein [Tannerellaceae bacterium]|jgi:uncharacterized protein (TIGR04255 family)|nr:TIGR04255 family protein [Tannerellaceae bacterium]